MTLEESILQDLGKEMAKSEDYTLLAQVLCGFGWTEAHTAYWPQQTWFEMIQWADNNCNGKYKEHRGHWLFSDPKDATMFILRWK